MATLVPKVSRTNLDSQTDDVRQARPQIDLLANNFNQLLDSLGTTAGLDAGDGLEISNGTIRINIQPSANVSIRCGTVGT